MYNHCVLSPVLRCNRASIFAALVSADIPLVLSISCLIFFRVWIARFTGLKIYDSVIFDVPQRGGISILGPSTLQDQQNEWKSESLRSVNQNGGGIQARAQIETEIGGL